MDYESFWYAIGFLLTDGNVHKNTIRVEIQNRDIEVLFILKKVFGGKITSTIKKEKTYARWTVNSKPLTLMLAKFGMLPNKSLNVRLIINAQEGSISLLRGIWDGDGSWYYKKSTNSFRAELSSASHGFLIDVNNLLVTLNFRTKNIKTRNKKTANGKTSTVYRICLDGVEARRLHETLYSNTEICLKRKKDKIKEWAFKTISSNGRKMWTNEEIKILKEALSNNASNEEISTLLTERSASAIRKMCWSLNQKEKNDKSI